jgi:putative transcriptional regulator
MMTKMFDELMNGLNEVDAFLAGKTAGYKVSVPTHVDVKSIRKRLNMTQAGFSNAFGFSIDAVKHWEGGRRTPEASARAFLTVIAKNPHAVISALHTAAEISHTSRQASGQKSAAKSKAKVDQVKKPTKKTPRQSLRAS